jgi:hypothetical protein
MGEWVKAFDAQAVGAALEASPELLAVRDARGRNWLHLACGASVEDGKRDASASIETARLLVARGLDINQEAFTEGAWKATPLWFAIGRGRNLALARWLLEAGSDPNYCLWAAAFNNDLEAIRLLAAHGAILDDPSVDESPFLGAVQWSHFAAAEALLKLGADANFRSAAGVTALHAMLKKASDKRHFAMLIAHGARGDIGDAEGVTAVQILRRKKDPAFRAMADQLLGG